MKKCSKCGVEKEETEFQKRYAQCKACCYEVKKAYRATEKGREKRKIEAIQARLSGKKQLRQKRYELTEKGKECVKRYVSKKHQTPEGKARMAAKNAVRYALRKGKIVRLPCLICGDVNSVAHHPSYAEDMRLCVTWLCTDHHNEIHNPPAEL